MQSNLKCQEIKHLSAPLGTTAHVGISLYGRESRSGHRHLDSKGAFARNTLDIFHIATDAGLGSVWKIRIWHDNKGTDCYKKPQLIVGTKKLLQP